MNSGNTTNVGQARHKIPSGGEERLDIQAHGWR